MKKTLKNLVEEGLLQKEKTGFDQIRKRIARAFIDLENARTIFPKDKVGAYRSAYDAMLQAGIALILSHGLRPKVRNFHKTVVECVEILVGDKYVSIIKQFDQMRKNRHELIYDVGTISRSEAEDAVKTAGQFIREVERIVSQKDHQKKLF